MEKTSMGLDENVAGLLCYVLGWITGLVFFLMEPENKFVRFHALQSIVVFGAITVVSIILSVIPVIGTVLSAMSLAVSPPSRPTRTFVLWIVLMIRAYQGVKFKLPWAGDFAEKRVG